MKKLLVALSMLLTASIATASMHSDAKNNDSIQRHQTSFVKGKDFQVVTPPVHSTYFGQRGAKIEVIEFFSYGCPWCERLEPALEKWLSHQSNNINFRRVPIVFRPTWLPLAKAYYTAESLGIEKQITPAIFKAIHEDKQNLSDPAKIEALFAKQGIDKQTFESAFNYSPTLDAQLSAGDKTASAYKITSIPSIAINGQYITNSGMANGDAERMMKIVSYLIKRVNEKSIRP